MKSQNQGFTLLEILVALSLFVIMAMLATTGLYNIFRNKEILNTHDKKLAALQQSLAIMDSDFQQIIDRPIITADNTPQIALLGNDKEVNFTRNGHINPFSQQQRSTLQRVQYQYNKPYLTRHFWPVLDRVSESPRENTVLFNDVTDFQIQYIDSKLRRFSVWPTNTLGNRAYAMKNPFPVAIELSMTSTSWGQIKQLYLIRSHSLYSRQLNHDTLLP